MQCYTLNGRAFTNVIIYPDFGRFFTRDVSSTEFLDLYLLENSKAIIQPIEVYAVTEEHVTTMLQRLNWSDSNQLLLRVNEIVWILQKRIHTALLSCALRLDWGRLSRGEVRVGMW